MIKIIEILKKQSPTKLIIGGSLILLGSVALSEIWHIFSILIPLGILIVLYSLLKVFGIL